MQKAMILQSIGGVLCSLGVIGVSWANFKDRQKPAWAMGGVFVVGIVLMVLAALV